MDKKQTEEQSEADKTESFEIMLGVGPGNLSSFEMTINVHSNVHKIMFILLEEVKD